MTLACNIQVTYHMQHDTLSHLNSFLLANVLLLLIVGHLETRLFAMKKIMKSITLRLICDFLRQVFVYVSEKMQLYCRESRFPSNVPLGKLLIIKFQKGR